jgi:hypothetical protein
MSADLRHVSRELLGLPGLQRAQFSAVGERVSEHEVDPAMRRVVRATGIGVVSAR